MRAESWCSDPLLARKNDPSAKFMKLSQGVGPYKFDEYSVQIDAFPTNLSPAAYLKEFAENPNRAVSSWVFDVANKFRKRVPGRIALGDIWDIDVMGPDNGSIVLVELSASFGKEKIDAWFDIQTIECLKYGTHPECGAREFGYEMVGENVRIYTRGVSRAYMNLHRAGTPVQRISWGAMLSGIAEGLKRRGAKVSNSSVRKEIVNQAC